MYFTVNLLQILLLCMSLGIICFLGTILYYASLYTSVTLDKIVARLSIVIQFLEVTHLYKQGTFIVYESLIDLVTVKYSVIHCS